MLIDIRTNFPDVAALLRGQERHVPYATAVALNKSAEWAETAVRKEMRKVFDRPTPWFINSLRRIRATKQNLRAILWFKDKNSVESSSTMVVPHIDGGVRVAKGFEKRLRIAGILPNGWYAVPGGGAKIDSYGNMSKGQISLLLNILGAYREAGYNKANAKTISRLKAGNAKKGVYGVTYWVNPVNGARAKHLPPGIWAKVNTGFGSAIKPVLLFVSEVSYRKRLDFYGIAKREAVARFQSEFEKAMSKAIATAK